MNKLEFHKHLKTGQEMPVLTASELEQLVDRYPFFQTAQLLLSQAYLQNGDYRQTDQVQQAALYAGDRSALFHLLHVRSSTPLPKAEPILEVPVDKVEVTTLPSTTEVVNEETSDAIRDLAGRMLDEPTPVASNEPSANLSDHWIPAILPQVEELVAPTIETVLEPTVKDAETVPSTKASDVLEPALNETILLEAIQRSLEQEIMDDVKEQQKEAKPSLALPSRDSSSLSPFAKWMTQRAQEIEFDAHSVSMPEGEMPEDSQNWLRKSVQTEKNSIEDRLEDLSPEDSQGLISHGAKRMDVPEKRDQQKALIDRFIQKEPRITPGKAADYSISDLAKESLEDDLEFVTETMAQLFVLQGKIDRAKKAFKKLMVLHPEKSVYFATQLKNIDRIKKL